ncbi:hypothetical protein EYF80_058165 [Liparis tanakae]|uniref:Uncharacterized protein n=1 Tax=Liparis tanakae TaxID=230148 RepID=A0A4Z2ES99_9TELE|nr:hypothetical protein EYF80_058165 [Liparis tanakae]
MFYVFYLFYGVADKWRWKLSLIHHYSQCQRISRQKASIRLELGKHASSCRRGNHGTRVC